MENTITDSVVIDYMKGKASELAKKTNEPYSLVLLSVNHNGEIEWKTYCAAGTWTTGKTLEEAVALQLLETGPMAQAKRIRREAEEMIKRAEQLELQAG